MKVFKRFIITQLLKSFTPLYPQFTTEIEMGIISSKLLKQDSKPTKVTTAMQTETPQGAQIPDVRSPTADIVRTPIIVDKFNPDMDTPQGYRNVLLKNKLLKNLKLDPRSPTIGIDRTPILIEDSSSNKTTPNNFDSPVSIYSCNLNDSLVEDVMTPMEPSMNVSEFEFPKEIYCGEYDVTLGDEDVKESEESKSCLKVSDMPNTYEAKRLLEEIISDEDNFLKKVKMPSRKAKKSSLVNPEKNLKQKGKFRPPLSNITSSTNSPGNINTGLKPFNKNKVVPEFGSENSGSPNVKHMIQWDQNNTVII